MAENQKQMFGYIWMEDHRKGTPCVVKEIWLVSILTGIYFPNDTPVVLQN